MLIYVLIAAMSTNILKNIVESNLYTCGDIEDDFQVSSFIFNLGM